MSLGFVFPWFLFCWIAKFCWNRNHYIIKKDSLEKCAFKTNNCRFEICNFGSHPFENPASNQPKNIYNYTTRMDLDLAAEKNLTFTESSCRTEGCMKMDHDRGFCSDSISEDKIWNTDSKQTDCKMMISPLGCYQKSPAKVIVTQDVEQLLFERNQMAKIAYDVCCMFINDKNFNCDQESADSGISEQEEQPVPKKQSKKCDQLAVAPARVTRSQSKTAKTENASTPKTESNPVSSMETFLSTSNAAFQKALLDSVKGTDIGALLDELEQQRAENNRLEKYLVELEQRRNALKLYYATTQNLIFQSEHPGTRIQHIG